jgi:hypothetical protein
MTLRRYVLNEYRHKLVEDGYDYVPSPDFVKAVEAYWPED